VGVRGVWGVRGVRGVRGQRAALVLPRQPRLDPPVSALRVSFALTRQISRVRNALAWRVARMCLTLLSRCAAGAGHATVMGDDAGLIRPRPGSPNC